MANSTNIVATATPRRRCHPSLHLHYYSVVPQIRVMERVRQICMVHLSYDHSIGNISLRHVQLSTMTTLHFHTNGSQDLPAYVAV